METKNYLTENLPKLQKALEDKLEIRFEEIKLKPLYKMAEDATILFEKRENKKIPKIWKNIIKGLGHSISFFNNFFSNNIFITNGYIPDTIYCNYKDYFESVNNSPSIKNQNRIITSILHELSHLSHYKIIDNPDHHSLNDKRLVEGFAEYISETIAKENFNLRCNIGINSDYGQCYPKDYYWFKKEIEKNNLKTANDFKNYLLKYKKN
ncbi:MAG: hypothetical protein AABX80_00585 [Nanoarchaeota archaeon]